MTASRLNCHSFSSPPAAPSKYHTLKPCVKIFVTNQKYLKVPHHVQVPGRRPAGVRQARAPRAGVLHGVQPRDVRDILCLNGR